MEQAIKKIRNSKVKVKQVFNMIKKEIDFKSSTIDSTILEELTLLSKIDEELTDVIYEILDSKNS